VTSRTSRRMQALSFKNISALYIAVGLFIVYSIWVLSTFLTAPVWKSLLASGAVTAMATIGLVLPLSAGVFDLAVGSEIGFGAIIFAWLLGDEHLPLLAAFAITMAVGAFVGTCSGLLITRAKIDSFIATLGMSSILLALIAWVSGGQQILNLGSSAQSVAVDQLLGVADPVWFMLVIAVLVWFVLQRTTLGRRVYATGGNPSAARLAGVRTNAVMVGVLVACGAIAAVSGSLISAQLATGDPTVGPAYLLPAYAAAFLGSTQFRGARYNVWGAVVAVYVLAIGVKGLQLAGARRGFPTSSTVPLFSSPSGWPRCRGPPAVTKPSAVRSAGIGARWRGGPHRRRPHRQRLYGPDSTAPSRHLAHHRPSQGPVSPSPQ
jgi:ribose transport system permease protein